jgi:RsiW-degrading membrane proteinase PrsW (M82 family)
LNLPLDGITLSPLTMIVHIAWLPLLFVLFMKMYKGPYPILAALLTHFVGGIMVVPALLMQILWNQQMPDEPLVTLLEMPLWFVPVEEWAKLTAALIAAKMLGYRPPRRCFLPLAVGASLGFAATESALAVAELGIDVLPIRVLVAIPGHIIFTTVAAASLVGKAGAKISRWALLGWWSLAAVSHTAYNMVVLYHPDADMLDIFMWLLSLAGIAAILAFFKYWQARPTE